MNKPVVFISSTIYDFSDLRSSMKYWLTENEMELPIVQIVKPLIKIFWKEPFWKPSVY